MIAIEQEFADLLIWFCIAAAVFAWGTLLPLAMGFRQHVKNLKTRATRSHG